MFQMVNNTISRCMLKILRKRIKQENKEIRANQAKKIKELVNFKVANEVLNFPGEKDNIELINNQIPNRKRFGTI